MFVDFLFLFCSKSRSSFPCSLPNIMAKLSFSDASMSNQSSVTQGLLVEERRPTQLDAMMDWERKAKLASEQQDFEAQFMCGYTEFETKASSAIQRSVICCSLL